MIIERAPGMALAAGMLVLSATAQPAAAYTFKMKPVYVSSYQTVGSELDDLPASPQSIAGAPKTPDRIPRQHMNQITTFIDGSAIRPRRGFGYNPETLSRNLPPHQPNASTKMGLKSK